MIGTEFGRYRLDRLLARGGMGEVYLAVDTTKDRVVALKVLPESLAADAVYRERFRRESFVAARLHNPHVVPIHDYGEIDGRLYIDMRLVDGLDVGAVLAAEGPMPPARAVNIITQVASALDAAHANGLVHRDIKPSNMLVTSDDFVYLVDFGIAQSTGDATLTSIGETIGTCDYMAPERFDDGVVDARSDVYSLACVLHQCLTAARPYPGDSLRTRIKAHLFAPPPTPSSVQPGVPVGFDAVVARGMAKNPADRYPTAGALGAAAQHVLATASEASHRPPDATAVAGTAATTAETVMTRNSEPDPNWRQPSPGPSLPVPAPQAPQAPFPAPRPAAPHAGSPHAGSPQAWYMAPGHAGSPHAGSPHAGSPPAPKRRRWILILLALLVVGAIGGGVLYWTMLRSGGYAVTAIAVGLDPVAVAVDPGTHTAYSANRGDNSVSVIDGKTHAVTAVEDVGTRPVAVAVDAVTHSIFTVNSADNTLSLIDGSTNTISAILEVGSDPVAVAVDPDTATVYTANRGDNSVSVIDAESRSIVAIAVVGTAPTSVAVDPGTRTIYTANNEDNTVSVIDGTSHEVTTIGDVGDRPRNVAVDPATHTIYVTNDGDNSVSVIDGATSTVVAAIPVEKSPGALAVDPAAHLIFVTHVYDNSVSVIDGARRTVRDTIAIGHSPGAIAVDPTTHTVYTTNNGAGSVSVITR